MAWQSLTINIAAGSALSDPVEIAAGRLASIALPAAWDAAALTFQISADGSNWSNWHTTNWADSSPEIKIPVPNAGIAVSLIEPAAARFLRVRSGTAGTPVNQTAARRLVLQLQT